ncbi:universal stress protein [Saccharothrix sp. 6-C]|uniref:universal stress protein n=1 Tax=Saccharothrix sp. 6-C TaxID=2781735 RepID=UPI00191797FF|nr:universal stress protein [Saccharothrix sp. 6-C]QQQ74054.1 universal stress protein [Saccharothrix sp. 6-C]
MAGLRHGDDEGPGGAARPVRRVLVATDFSEGAAVALRRAFGIAGRHGAGVTVVHVVPRGLADELAEAADRELRRLVRDAPAPADTALVTGAVGSVIASEVERHQADLVVVGAHGAHWLRGAFLGSTAELVVEVSPVPVLLVKGGDTPEYSTVLSAVDASSRSFRAAQLGLALTRGTRYVLAHAVTILGENLLRLNGADDHAIDELRGGQLAPARAEVERLAEDLTPAPSDILVEPGRPEEVISRLAARHGADLVVVGVEQGAKLRRALIGSVSRHAMRGAPCDVLVVPVD